MKKCKLIILGAGDVTLEFVKKCLKNRKINLVGVIPDSSVNDNYLQGFCHSLKDMQINILALREEDLNKADIVFSPEYRRIIPETIVKKHLIINCHGGILPQYRGFAANAWAIMNDAKEIGYSIHRMNKELDDGEVYYIKRIPISNQQTYSDVHGEMVKSILDEVPDLLVNIYNGASNPVKQEGMCMYGTRFNPQMGELKDFNLDSNYFINLYRCMAEPLGSGLYFIFKGMRYRIGKVIHGRERRVLNYIGIPGKIVNITEEGLWVKTKDNVIILSDIRDENDESVNVKCMFKNGNKI